MTDVVRYRQLADTLALGLKGQAATKKLPSVRQLARLYRVSAFTVSKALKMLEQRGVIVRRWGVGCFPSARPRQRPAAGSTPKLGILLGPAPPATHGWNDMLMEAVLASMRSLNAEPVYLSWQERLALDAGINGVLVPGFLLDGPQSERMLRWLRDVAGGGIGVVTIDCQFSGLSSVQIDNTMGAYQAARYLCQLGHRSIAYQGPPGNPQSAERLAGVRKALKDNGISHDPELVWETRPSPHATYSLFPTFYRPGRFSAVCCFEDGAAAGIVKAARDAGIPVPGDLSVIGYGNLPLGEFAVLPLTTVDVHLQELASQAVRLLLEQGRDDATQVSNLRVRTSLIVRESTGPAPAAARHG